MSPQHQALARTTLLINRGLFDGKVEEDLIADALLGTCVRLAAGPQAMRTRAGQTALVTAFSLIGRMGVGIELDVSNEPLIDRVSPLRKSHIADALLDLGGDLIPGAMLRTERDEVIASITFGEPSLMADDDICVSVDDYGCEVQRGTCPGPCIGELPFGGFAAGAALAAVVLDTALPAIEAATNARAREPRPLPGPPLRLDLRQLFPTMSTYLPGELGKIDAISGGAITNSLLFCLLRIPGVEADMRVIEADIADLSNLNRYALLRASDVGLIKTDLLKAASGKEVKIHGVRTLFTKETRNALAPLAERVVVGADDVEARWWVQESNPRWLAIGATNNQLAQLTTHMPGSPCAGCAHPVPVPPGVIPTTSFISFWAGLLQACALLCGEGTPRNVSVFPFALGGPMPWVSATPAFSPGCPISCLSPLDLDRDVA